MRIQFGFPGAVSPKDIGTGSDPRKMAMGLYAFEANLVSKRGPKQTEWSAFPVPHGDELALVRM